MANVSIKESSKINWTVTPVNQQDYPGDTNIQLGCLMRIADATEKMTANYTNLQNDRDMYKRWYNEEQEKTKKMYRQIAALKGHFNRLKKELNNKL